MSGGLDRFSVRASLAQEFLLVRNAVVIEDQDRENFRVLRSHSDTFPASHLKPGGEIFGPTQRHRIWTQK